LNCEAGVVVVEGVGDADDDEEVVGVVEIVPVPS